VHTVNNWACNGLQRKDIRMEPEKTIKEKATQVIILTEKLKNELVLLSAANNKKEANTSLTLLDETLIAIAEVIDTITVSQVDRITTIITEETKKIVAQTSCIKEQTEATVNQTKALSEKQAIWQIK